MLAVDEPAADKELQLEGIFLGAISQEIEEITMEFLEKKTMG